MTSASHKAPLSTAVKILGGVLLLLFFSMPAWAQNTKGDRPVGNQRQVRETKSKSVKRKSNGRNKDLAGRRLRTRNKSSASRANANYPQPSPYRNKRTSTERAARPRGRTFTSSPRESRSRAWTGDISGHRIRTKKPSSRSDAARNNVYPQNGAYVNNPSRKPKNKPPKVYTRTANGKPVVNRAPTQRQRAWKGNMKGGPVGSPSATGMMSNTYSQSGPYSRYSRKKGKARKERSYSNSGIAGRNLRLSSEPGQGGRKTSVYPQSATGPFVKRGRKNVYWGKYSKGEKPFLKDLSGNPLRARNFRSPAPGFAGLNAFRTKRKGPGGDRAYRGTRGGFMSATSFGQRAWRGDLAGRRIRSPKRGITSETPGQFVLSRKLSISSSGKVGRQMKGGGFSSRSNRRGDNRPLPARTPGIGASSVSKEMARTKGQRPLRGGGSASGGVWNNRNRPISARAPGIGASSISKGLARTKGQRPFRGGGSVSGGGWNNKNQPIMGRSPGIGASSIGRALARTKGQRPFHGGGSVSGGGWNNKNQPIMGRSPGIGASSIGRALARTKGQRPLHGGGSVSGGGWNNKNQPIAVRTPGQGSMRAGNFSGNIRARRPEKGGGSVSGQLWNNKEKPLDVRPPGSAAMRAGNFSGNIKTRRDYIQNPNSHEESLKKRKPDETAYKVAGLQVKVKRGKYEEKPRAAEEAMLGIGPKDGTRKASEFSGTTKVVRNYKHNPKSAKEALDGIPPSSASVKASEYSRSMKQYWKYKHSPLGSEDALKVRAPNKAYARIGEYQGNIKMRKYNEGKLHPDAQFAHTHRGNVKEDRTILMDVKLLWSKFFKKSDTQPASVKEKVLKPRYDKSEKGLWADDPSYTKKKNEPKPEVEQP